MKVVKTLEMAAAKTPKSPDTFVAYHLDHKKRLIKGFICLN